MPVVDENRLKGNYAAFHVAARLSSGCLVRPVAGGTDVGIDLHCETVERNRPFLHFWVQVKAGAQCKVLRGGTDASVQFEKRHLDYWSRQPVPVFAALVPEKGATQKDPTIYIVSISSYLLHRDIGKRKTMTLRSTIALPPSDENAAAELECKKGLVRSEPELSPQYVRSFPWMPVMRFRERIEDQIRTTAAMAVVMLCAQNQVTRATLPFMHRLGNVLEQFPDDPHWETPMAQGLSCHADRKYKKALKFYGMAERSIREDRELDASSPPWSEEIRWIGNMRGLAVKRETIVQVNSGSGGPAPRAIHSEPRGGPH
jgi:hypothetical protein